MDSQHHERTNAQEQGLLEEGLPEATALVGQRTGGAEHLHQGDDTEEEKQIKTLEEEIKQLKMGIREIKSSTS